MLHALSGADPLFVEDRPMRHRTNAERLEDLVRLPARDHPAVKRFAPLVLGLMADAPADRWTLARARADTAAPRPAAVTAPAAPRLPRLLHDGLSHLLDTMRPGHGERLWAPGTVGRTADPVAVQHGSADPLAVLARALPVFGDALPGLREGLRAAAHWTAARHQALPGRLPGLHHGRSGTAWALLDAANALGDRTLAARAADLALDLPLHWPNPDVCHGVAGAGLAQLHFWRTTGDPRFLTRAVEAADGLLVLQCGFVIYPVSSSADRRR
ncbi:lanthionine synthetase LanC family protein [Streptomyces sp. NPDC001389]|uniref:lanthionine synthetase LanC family protein n=1 Tax=Streptomyces sp. NPDC001389 TaxID=3364569 RepID=UPI003696988C